MDAAVPGDVNEADQSIIFPGAEINSLLEYARAAAAAIRARVAAVVDVALAAVDVAATAFVMNECGRFHRRHLLAEVRHIALVLRGRRRDPGLDDQIVAAAISTYCLDISEPKTVRGLEAGYRLYTARWELSDLTARRRPPTPAPDPDRQPPADPGEPAAPRSSGQDAGEWETPRIPLQYVTAAALLTAWRSMPEAPEGRFAHVDVAGAVVLAAALLLVLFLGGERNLWSRHLAVAAGLGVVAVVLLGVWAVIELRSTTPLVDVPAMRHPAVAGANLAMFVGGIGMYLLLTLITRYAQTPHAARRRLRLRADDLRRGAGPHPVLGAGVRRRQAHAAGPDADRRPPAPGRQRRRGRRRVRPVRGGPVGPG
jgi:hypothetical protein